jgi:hypothetical protein
MYSNKAKNIAHNWNMLWRQTCSSSTTRRPRLLYTTRLPRSEWVPTIMSKWPCLVISKYISFSALLCSNRSDILKTKVVIINQKSIQLTVNCMPDSRNGCQTWQDNTREILKCFLYFSLRELQYIYTSRSSKALNSGI